jgi:general secretion pathway protein M
MKLTPIINEMQNSWNKREPKERRILAALALVVLVSLIFLIGVFPARQNIDKLEKDLPRLKQQAAEMSALAGQYAQMAQAMAENIPPITRELVESTLSRRNIKTQTISVTNEIVRVQINSVAYSNLMEWLLEVQKVARLSVEEVKLTTASEQGQVTAVLTLRQQRATQ